jgi:ABC-type glycerol-3-phosphate transport system substrate-binding protein
MIDETFTRDTDIGVNLMLVDMGQLLPATLSRQGPDVAMTVDVALPMNYGLRGAVADIAHFHDFEEITKRFKHSAMVPFIYRDWAFALPETQSFYMLFYRKDVLYEIGVEIPRTWDDVTAALSILSKNYMDFGLPLTGSATGAIDFAFMSYTMFLYQNGGQIYTDDKMRSALDSDIAINTFRDFTRFFTDYRLPQNFDFVNRFRHGEMPLAVFDYTAYNTLQVFAPEIRGLWGFTMVPGTVQEDGTVDHSVPTGGAAVIMMELARDKPSAWEYMKWWTSASVQTQFGRQMEALMGSAARYPSANQEAFEMLPWPVEDFRNLTEQFSWAQGIPQVPGGYFTERQVRNAFYRVVTDRTLGPRESLTDFVRYINDEIAYKRWEFGLDYTN